MKTKFIFLIFLLFSLLSFGQVTYKSFIHLGVTKWLYYSPQDGCLTDEVDAYGDTIINKLTYKKLWRTHFVASSPYTNANQQWREYKIFSCIENAFIRQSSDSSKLYLLDANNNIEHLITDMNLKVGDEFVFPFGSDTVASIIFKDGLKNIQFKNTNSAWEKLTFIESVGSNMHILSAMKNFAFPTNILICYSNSSYFYNIVEICACNDTKIKDISTDTYKITKLLDFIEISFAENAHRTLEIFDISGRGIEKLNIVNQQSIQIPIIELKSGIYFLRIYNHDNKEYKSLKIIL